MFQILEPSGRRRPPVLGGLLAAGTHFALGLAAFVGIGHVVTPPPQVHRDSLLIYLPPIPAPIGVHSSRSANPTLPAFPDIHPIAATIPGVPDVLPQIPAADPFRLATSSMDRTGRARADSSPSVGLLGADQVWLGGEVDEAVSVLKVAIPRYPAALETAGVSGRVVLEFVVDTTGRVEPGSLRVVSSSTTDFEAAARDAMLATEFRPAKARGVRVRQLARQAIAFVGRS